MITYKKLAALVSFTFNLGAVNLNTLLKNGLAVVPDRILLFDHAGGKGTAGSNPPPNRQASPLPDTLTFGNNNGWPRG